MKLELSIDGKKQGEGVEGRTDEIWSNLNYQNKLKSPEYWSYQKTCLLIKKKEFLQKKLEHLALKM